jgi:hypothetical protein
MKISKSCVDNWHDNAVAESFCANPKNELTFPCDFGNRRQVKSVIFDYIVLFYNRKRPHQTMHQLLSMKECRLLLNHVSLGDGVLQPVPP